MSSLVKFSLVLTTVPNRKKRKDSISSMTTIQQGFPALSQKEHKEFGLNTFNHSFTQKYTNPYQINYLRRN